MLAIQRPLLHLGTTSALKSVLVLCVAFATSWLQPPIPAPQPKPHFHTSLTRSIAVASRARLARDERLNFAASLAAMSTMPRFAPAPQEPTSALRLLARRSGILGPASELEIAFDAASTQQVMRDVLPGSVSSDTGAVTYAAAIALEEEPISPARRRSRWQRSSLTDEAVKAPRRRMLPPPTYALGAPRAAPRRSLAAKPAPIPQPLVKERPGSMDDEMFELKALGIAPAQR